MAAYTFWKLSIRKDFRLVDTWSFEDQKVAKQVQDYLDNLMAAEKLNYSTTLETKQMWLEWDTVNKEEL